MKNKNHYSNEKYEAGNCAKTKIEVQTNNKKTHGLFFWIAILVIGCVVLGVTGYIKSRINEIKLQTEIGFNEAILFLELYKLLKFII